MTATAAQRRTSRLGQTANNAAEVAGDLAALAGQVASRSHALVVSATASLQRQVMANASGRPGPNAPTGNYRRSINRRTTKLAGGSIGTVGTNQPQGRRLEFGFTGEDSLGRTYDQPAYPHFTPAIDFVGAGFVALAEKIGVPES